MGTPAFACPILSALLGRSDPVVGVVCQPDRPRGRGLGVTAPEVKQLALAGEKLISDDTGRGIAVRRPERVSNELRVPIDHDPPSFARSNAPSR